jgi:A/G-specific adenine glycosylase
LPARDAAWRPITVAQFPTIRWSSASCRGGGLHGRRYCPQAFDRRLPILEANSQRVLSRLFGRRDDPRAASGGWLWKAAGTAAQHVGDFNQALMERSSLVASRPRAACAECPLASDCEAKRLGLQGKIPPPARQPES